MPELVGLWQRQQVLRGGNLVFQGLVTLKEVAVYPSEGQWALRGSPLQTACRRVMRLQPQWVRTPFPLDNGR